MIVEHFWPFAAWWRSATHFIHLTSCQPTFYLFTKVKMALKGNRFQDIKDIKKNVTLNASDDCFMKLLERCKMCVAV
jgi:hypothetical protein